SGRNCKIEPKAVSAMCLRAKRPRFSALDNERLRSAGFEDMRGWRDALKEYLSVKGYIEG
ncbi:MAG TPA: dTDP-4-dehydrorhamnose reductase, partial [Nitrospiria bacterium]|nr:dTDP-4-dehydrorhamnose reductase [Nitrospiria bacterium]